MFTDAQLAAAVSCPIARATRWGDPYRAALREFGIDTPRRIACFLGQIGHESQSMSRLEENLNYSAQRLVEVFPTYFTRDLVAQYAGHPERIASRVYAGRMGNGPESSGDGWRFRGRTHVQLTHRHNYRWIGQILALPLEDTPELALETATAARVAAAFWQGNKLNVLADADDVLAIGRKINLGNTTTKRLPNGHADRLARTNRAKAALGVK